MFQLSFSKSLLFCHTLFNCFKPHWRHRHGEMDIGNIPAPDTKPMGHTATLIRLPTEIRLKIYEVCRQNIFAESPTTYRALYNCPPNVTGIRYRRYEVPNIFLVNRQLYSESLPVMIGEKTFEMVVEASDWGEKNPLVLRNRAHTRRNGLLNVRDVCLRMGRFRDPV